MEANICQGGLRSFSAPCFSLRNAEYNQQWRDDLAQKVNIADNITQNEAYLHICQRRQKYVLDRVIYGE